MCYKDKLLSNPKNSVLSYFGAALLGLVLSTLFHLTSGGQVLLGIGIYFGYMVFITIIDHTCTQGLESGCEFNEFWITLEQLIKNKLGI